MNPKADGQTRSFIHFLEEQLAFFKGEFIYTTKAIINPPLTLFHKDYIEVWFFFLKEQHVETDHAEETYGHSVGWLLGASGNLNIM